MQNHLCFNLNSAGMQFTSCVRKLIDRRARVFLEFAPLRALAVTEHDLESIAFIAEIKVFLLLCSDCPNR